MTRRDIRTDISGPVKDAIVITGENIRFITKNFSRGDLRAVEAAIMGAATAEEKLKFFLASPLTKAFLELDHNVYLDMEKELQAVNASVLRRMFGPRSRKHLLDKLSRGERFELVTEIEVVPVIVRRVEKTETPATVAARAAYRCHFQTADGSTTKEDIDERRADNVFEGDVGVIQYEICDMPDPETTFVSAAGLFIPGEMQKQRRFRSFLRTFDITRYIGTLYEESPASE